MACKPGSVHSGFPEAMAIHLGLNVTASLMQPTRATAWKRAFEPKLRCRPYSVLLPVGFTLTVPVARAAVRSYRTLSPLPDAWFPAYRAVCFLWHFPWGRPRRALPGTVFSWSPDFPRTIFTARGHPAIWHLQT